MPYCPECGGVMLYDRSAKKYSCQSCGLVLDYQELIMYKEKIREEIEVQKKRESRQEYLEWWLSKKKS